jgi:hypothetical protein
MPSRIILGYNAALAASTLVFWGVRLACAVALGTYRSDVASFAGVFVLIGFTFTVALLLTALPFLVFFGISYFFGIRSWSYFVVSGALMGFAIIAAAAGAGRIDWRQWWGLTYWQDLPVEGALGGLIYWLVAVRNDGRRGHSPA